MAAPVQGGGSEALEEDGEVGTVLVSLSKHMGDGKVKLGREPYAISTDILSMYAGFWHPRTKHFTFFGMCFFMWFCK